MAISHFAQFRNSRCYVWGNLLFGCIHSHMHSSCCNTFEVGLQMLGKAFRDLRDFTVSRKLCSAPGMLFWPWARPCCFFKAAALDCSGGGAVDDAGGVPASPSLAHQSTGCCRNMTLSATARLVTTFARRCYEQARKLPATTAWIASASVVCQWDLPQRV